MIEGEPLIRWDWVTGHLDEIGQRLVEHVELTAIAVGVGFVIAFALALLIIRRPRLESPITFVTGTLYTIPSLALFVLLIPYTGLSLLTAEIGLVTVTALIGQGGFGYFILIGIQRFFSTELIVGAACSVALAIAADALLVLLQRRLTPWTRPA